MQGSAAMSAGSGVTAGYGLAESGASWEDARAVLVLVHGRDGSPEEMAGLLSPELTERLRVLAPYAEARIWYPGRYDAPMAENEAGRDAALAAIDGAFAAAAERGFGPERVILAGFSQGGCLVTEYLIAGRQRPAGAAIFTGTILARNERTLPERDLADLPIIVCGGSGDAWLPLGDFLATEAVLSQMGGNVHLEMFPDAQHMVRPEEIRLLGRLVDQLAP
ncbi:alpha/beta hydrolase [Pseudoroseicyclus sp. CXY001]|uniref:alpha/beta hydrolase n=1 Tax=Pseudoroseicyclus sp. CXY001 TaxID=3242492 RepID=UPI00357174D5